MIIDLTQNLSWDEYFLKLAYFVSAKSKDIRTKIGSVVAKNKRILSTGYNGIPAGCNDELIERQSYPTKKYYFSHSEANSIFFAARNGVNISESSIYTLATPCSNCAQAIIQSGIKSVIIHSEYNRLFENDKDWEESCKHTKQMFLESGVDLIPISTLFNFKVLVHGKEYII